MADEKDTNTKAQADATTPAEGEHVPVDRELLEQVLDVVRPSLQVEGGDCRLVDVDDNGVVSLELTGACSGCPLSSITLSMGVERILKEHVPGVTKVVEVPGAGAAAGGSAMQSMLGYGRPPQMGEPDSITGDDDEEDIPPLL
jgi:Fe-S cluster biogenesis protein NfuA